MLRFELEDFFDEFEHRADLINLASSDALPWSASALGPDVSTKIATISLGYPDPKRLLPPLRRALAPPADVGLLPTSGAAEAIALAMHEIAERSSTRDCAIALPSPSYGAFRGLADLLGLKVKQYDYHASIGWRPDPEEMYALAEECSAFIVNNPHNPSGHVIPHEQVEQISKMVSARGGVLIVDEVFRFPNETRSAIEINNDVVILGSLSKTHGLPGLRLGWIAARTERLSRYRTLQQYMSLTLNAFTVAIGCSVLEHVPKFDRLELVRANRSLVMDWADRLHGRISISAPSGGTTICVMTDAPIDEGALFRAALDTGVLIAPGNTCFGRDVAQTWFRLGYGTETKELKLGLERLEMVINGLSSKTS